MRHKPTLTQEEKLVRMTESPLPGLIFSLAVPTIVSMLISALYNMADTYFVGLIGQRQRHGRYRRGVSPDEPDAGHCLHVRPRFRQSYFPLTGRGRRG